MSLFVNIMTEVCCVCLESLELSGKKELCQCPCGYARKLFHRQCLMKVQAHEEATAIQHGNLIQHRCPHCNVEYQEETIDQKLLAVRFFIKDMILLYTMDAYCKRRMPYFGVERGILMGLKEQKILTCLVKVILETIHEYGMPQSGVSVLRNGSDTEMSIRFQKGSGCFPMFLIKISRVAFFHNSVVYKDGFEIIAIRSKNFNLRRRLFNKSLSILFRK